MDDEALRAAIARHFWFHSIELRPGIVTPGLKTPEIMHAEEEALLGSFDLSGLSVLDIGAWNGGFTLAALRRGAGRVLATDSFTWDAPHFRGRETFDLACAASGLRPEARHLDPTELPAGLDPFDLVLFLGVFYHLRDPIPVVDALGQVTRQVLLLETHQDALEEKRPAMIFYPGDELVGDATNWWGPNPPLILHLLLQAGFDRVLYRPHPVFGRSRGLYAAFRPRASPALREALPAPWTEMSPA
ncbi:class I SAM-dependent methyltransferase [Sabulicella glaciei]|uniref:Class I SAM-dependent methyltransferase n=1 Tax=Sabulicella glaciei TaxID=2984948 RepID=A0ABT3NYH2_9PROT|nr:class I SAM-dependent methyltransferase [Roseococcus sp. MDT2-1-1]MCW8087213.1 class I SAM-dependent methyltransferase [Roseococcus sp. MDT2-1-1]